MFSAYDKAEQLNMENEQLKKEVTSLQKTVKQLKAKGCDKDEDKAMIKEMYETINEFVDALDSDHYKHMLRETIHKNSRFYHLKRFIQGRKKLV